MNKTNNGGNKMNKKQMVDELKTKMPVICRHLSVKESKEEIQRIYKEAQTLGLTYRNI